MKRRALVLLLWLGVLAVCVAGAARARFTADLSAFLPSSPSEEQQLLVDLLRDGMVSRLLLIGIEGGEAAQRAAASRALAGQLRADPAFLSVNNGEPVALEADRAWFFDHRYLLSPAVTPQRFSDAGLAAAIGETLDMLASSAGLLIKPLLTRDPSGEMLRVLELFDGKERPALAHGVWASADGARALLVATTRATGADTDGQEAAIGAVRSAFEQARATAAAPELQLLVSGPGVFAVGARATIKEEVQRLALLGAGLIVALLLVVVSGKSSVRRSEVSWASAYWSRKTRTAVISSMSVSTSRTRSSMTGI
jgi:predicted exporter